MTNFLAEEITKLGLEVVTAKSRAGHILGARFPDGLPPGLMESLRSRNVFVSVRGNAVRIAPHVYNNQQDLEKTVAAIKSSLGN